MNTFLGLDTKRELSKKSSRTSLNETFANRRTIEMSDNRSDLSFLLSALPTITVRFLTRITPASLRTVL